ncbi:amphoterin-induced protein 2-like [Anopheles ziemanni]|uniref:amphoterin-induced protein 2-like n=1 Tax=Anopheles coustani TaxID=139045 RepID=UPI0026590A72|nr:amphoterin-induced protein 2-like [Anopheles coustani]XP_058177091.1 amphoterin-induced protein 2-like [Anopheles ziemanni]
MTTNRWYHHHHHREPLEEESGRKVAGPGAASQQFRIAGRRKQQTGRSRGHRTGVLAALALALLLAAVNAEPNCPSACQCKWKGGKQAVECLSGNLFTIPENIDHSTQVLDVSGNNLQIISNETFVRSNLLNLQKLYMRDCRIGQIDDGAFAGLTNLVELDLSINLLTAVPSAAFQHIVSLRDLTLARNHIQKIESHAFRNVTALTKLDLSFCSIQTIAPQAFEGLGSLHSLKLNGNQLSELRPKTIETLSRLHGIELHENPWVCDCRLRAAKLWLTENNIPYPIAPTCAGGPERVLDKTFGELQVDDFACKPEMLPVRRFIQAYSGENATIECRSSAVPSATVNWFWNGKLLVNNSHFSAYQRVLVYEQGNFEKRSKLVLTNAQETDSSEFYCVVENRAGTAEANFTLHVAMRDIGFAIENRQIIGLSAALVILILFILLIILFLLVRLRRIPMTETKTPNQVEVITSVSPSSNVNGKVATPINDCHSPDRKNAPGDLKCCQSAANPVQKPPRLTDLPYSTSHYDGGGSLIASGQCFVSPTHSLTGNNPDLINDTKRLGSGTDLAATGATPLDPLAHLTQLQLQATTALNTLSLMDPVERPGSGEYSRAGCDSLYPSGLWETHSSNLTAALDSREAGAGGDLLMARTPAYSDKHPILGQASAGTTTLNMDDETSSVDYLSRTFPRTHAGTTSLSVAGSATSASYGSAATAAATGGYPADYGLPIVPGAEQLHNKLASAQPAHHGSTGSMPMNAKTLRVWQKGGVPVLPPVTALKRALSNSRNSPDEGYQEGCGTDV